MARATFVLHSTLPLDRFEAALRENVSKDQMWREVFPIFLFAKAASPVVVKYLKSEIRLRRLHYWIHNSWFPLFYARYEAEPAGTRIEGFFDIHPFTKWFMRIWLGGLAFFAALFAFHGLKELNSGSLSDPDGFKQAIFTFLGMAAFGILLPKFGAFLGRGDKQFILDFLGDRLLARPEKLG